MKITNTKNHDFYVWFIYVVKSYFYGKEPGTSFPIRVIREAVMLKAAETQGDPKIAEFLLRLKDPKQSNDLVVGAIRALNCHAEEVGFSLAKEPGKKNGRNIIFTPVQPKPMMIPTPGFVNSGMTKREILMTVARLIGELLTIVERDDEAKRRSEAHTA